MKQRLALAETSPEKLIRDDELRRRCVDLITAQSDFDRAIAQACLVLEDRVRKAAGRATAIGKGLMQTALSPKSGPIQLSSDGSVQQGAMEIYAGIMAFFRNATGHKIVTTYTRDEALRFVAFIDLLLAMVADATQSTQASPPSGP